MSHNHSFQCYVPFSAPAAHFPPAASFSIARPQTCYHPHSGHLVVIRAPAAHSRWRPLICATATHSPAHIFLHDTAPSLLPPPFSLHSLLSSCHSPQCNRSFDCPRLLPTSAPPLLSLAPQSNRSLDFIVSLLLSNAAHFVATSVQPLI